MCTNFLLARAKELSKELQEECVELVRLGGEIDAGLEGNVLTQTQQLAVLRGVDHVIGVGAIKIVRPDRSREVSARAKCEFDPELPELGYIAVHPDCRNTGLSRSIVKALLSCVASDCWATTRNESMRSVLEKYGFSAMGESWITNSEKDPLWLMYRKTV
jgi:hypothetical protein